MPRNVRNFWIEAEVDGKATKVGTGPQARDGGFSLEIKMRSEGGIVTAAKIIGLALEDGELSLFVNTHPEEVADSSVTSDGRIINLRTMR